MRNNTNKSIKLNRQLDKLLVEAMKKDLLVKIGWGREQDKKPRDGEIGAITLLPDKSKVLLLGNLGECAGAMNNGGVFTLQGSATSMLGAFQESGKIIVERDVGAKAGYKMKGGSIIIQGSAGIETGAGMLGGTIIVRGHTGDSLGASMQGGMAIILGSTGAEPGVGMRGGKLVIAGSCPPPGESVSMRSINKTELEECEILLKPLGLTISDDALVLETLKILIHDNNKIKSHIAERFENISLIPDNNERIPEHNSIDPYTLVLPNNLESEGILFPIPWLVEVDNSNKWKGFNSERQPALVTDNPRKIDFVIINDGNLSNAKSLIDECAGIFIDLKNLPPMNDAELEAIIVSLKSRMIETSLIFLRDDVNRVEELFRLVVELDLDGAFVDASVPGGGIIAASLPLIGLAAKTWEFKKSNRTIMIGIDKNPDVQDMLIANASGCNLIVGPYDGDDIESDLIGKNIMLKKWMVELGIDGLEKIGRKNLRANDYNTAAISGLRLIGYNRPLPMWLQK